MHLVMNTVHPYSSFCAYYRKLFNLASNLFTFQCKHHIRGALKEANVAPPARAALAMEQADELLLHFAPTIRADTFACSHCFYLIYEL